MLHGQLLFCDSLRSSVVVTALFLSMSFSHRCRSLVDVANPFRCSMMNAPLINLTRSPSVSDFMERCRSGPDSQRPFVATSLHPTSVSLFSPTATPALLSASRDAFVFMGSEGDGLPEEITGDERCTNLRIPSMVRRSESWVGNKVSTVFFNRSRFDHRRAHQ